MKILLITEFFADKNKYFSGGVEARTYFIARHLAQQHKVVVICRRKKDEEEIETEPNLKIIRLGKETGKIEVSLFSIIPRFLFLVASFRQALKQDLDLVEGSNFICLIPAYLTALFKKKPVIAWYPDVYGREWFKNFGLFTGLFGWLLEKIGLFLPWSGIIALSKQTKNKLIKAGINPEKIKVVYGGVDIDFIRSIKAKKYLQPTVCCIARLVSYKNIDCLLKAIKIVKKKIPAIKCIIVGKGPEKEKLLKLTRELALAYEVVFKQNLSYRELIKTLKSSWIFCLPSKIEGFGLVTIEALACCTPFVVVDMTINKEITQGKGGLFFEANNFQDLVNKLILLLKNKSLSAKLINQSKELLKNYRWQKISLETEELYKKLAVI